MSRSALQNSLVKAAVVAGLILSAGAAALGWGMTGHEIAVRRAVGILPDEMKPFFVANRENITLFADEPDALSRVDSSEGANHYLDLDAFDSYPFHNIPADEAEFAKRFGAEATGKGRLPWAVRDTYGRLVAAFRARDYEAILEHAGYLAHYVSDSTMPLHATKNYKGQETGNVVFSTEAADRHVHVRFEIGMIDLYFDDIDKAVAAAVGQPHRVEDAAAEALANLKASYSLIDRILETDKEALAPEGKADTLYYKTMYDKVGDVAKAQLALAAEEVASYWRSAWEDAGKPRLIAGEVRLTVDPLTIKPAEKAGNQGNETEAAK